VGEQLLEAAPEHVGMEEILRRAQRRADSGKAFHASLAQAEPGRGGRPMIHFA
jgi:hypothetical protein